MRSFEAVTGRKTDDWLVRMVGLLATAIGGTLVLHSRSEAAPPLAAATAASFLAVDVVYSANGTISPIYLTDAALQTAFLLALARSQPAVPMESTRLPSARDTPPDQAPLRHDPEDRVPRLQ